MDKKLFPDKDLAIFSAATLYRRFCGMHYGTILTICGADSEVIMFPWLWFWAPQIHFPWSGSVAQQIDPDLGWFFGAIRPNAGNGTVEREAFEVATYGKQLGLISEAVLGHSGRSVVTPDQANVALERLEGIRKQIHSLKRKHSVAAVELLSEQLEELRLSQPAEFEQLAKKFRLSISTPSA